MIDTKETVANQAKLGQVRQCWEQLIQVALRRGFHGTVSLEINIQDGTIQHLRKRVDQLER